MEEYREIILGRFMDLPDEEKTILSNLPGTEVGNILGKLFGPELGGLIVDESIQDENQGELPLEEAPMKRAGLGAR
jgi:hypothetical protein